MVDSSILQEPPVRLPRRFAVEPVEVTTKSSKLGDGGKDAPKDKNLKKSSPRRFAPQPIETSVRSNRRGETGNSFSSSSSSPTRGVVTAREDPSSSHSKPLRKFAPQLLETSTRSRRRGDTVPALRELTDKTDLSPGDHVHLPRQMRLERTRAAEDLPDALPIPSESSPAGSRNEVPTLSESKFSSANLLQRRPPRRTSCHRPVLEPINSLPESDESNNQSNVPSLSTTPSADSEPVDISKHPARLRESMDDRFSGYLLALAAKVAEQQLKEQAMAAYPNENMHEPVDHFAVNHESEENSEEEMGYGMLSRDEHDNTDTSVGGGRRESAAGWDLEEMRKHQDNLAQQRANHKEQEARLEALRAKASPPVVPIAATAATAAVATTNTTNAAPAAAAVAASKSPFTRPFGALPDLNIDRDDRPTIGGGIRSPGPELKQMRSAASPPMLGADLVFRTCPSPKATMIDATQRPRKRNKESNYHDSIGIPASREHSGLWTPVSHGTPVGTPQNLSRKQSSAGLWHGVCQAESQHHGLTDGSLAPPPGVGLFQSGLMTPAPRTPAHEAANPFDRVSFGVGLFNSSYSNCNSSAVESVGKPCPGADHLTPPPSTSHQLNVQSIDAALGAEAELESEFPDSFVTQVYNYLSLGYPALARKFDAELSKISRVGVEEIRRDDARRDTKGFVGAPEGEGWDEERVRDACGRWRALRMYVREWGRQEGRMVRSDAGAWGQVGRRGSWAI